MSNFNEILASLNIQVVGSSITSTGKQKRLYGDDGKLLGQVLSPNRVRFHGSHSAKSSERRDH